MMIFIGGVLIVPENKNVELNSMEANKIDGAWKVDNVIH